MSSVGGKLEGWFCPVKFMWLLTKGGCQGFEELSVLPSLLLDMGMIK